MPHPSFWNPTVKRPPSLLRPRAAPAGWSPSARRRPPPPLLSPSLLSPHLRASDSGMQADSSVCGGAEDAAGAASLLERVAGLLDGVLATQRRMDERQLELESAVRDIRAGVFKLAAERAGDADVLEKLLEKTRKVSRHIKDVRVRLENQNLRVKKVEATQGDLLAKNKFRVVIYQGEQEARGATPADDAGGQGEGDAESHKLALPPDSDDDEYMVVEEADSAAGRQKKKTGLTRMESLKATFSRENMSRTRDSLGTKVNKLGERIVTAERRQKIRRSGERLKETLAKNVLKKERTVAEGQEGADPAAAVAEGAAPVPPPKGRRAAAPEAEGGGARGGEVPVYDMKRLS
ncbi:caveolae-associated protein 4a-like [Phyllopteryx taeniolatus]|uniref:caveolae-associated protein 4a-like n=1 Tax=Phyllopteryx taeniolatus TaxID=161469 RepID=UPI002AD43A30|nr:caveolae-associated protein 4a-like [Phyllopteryx taeniolatus]